MPAAEIYCCERWIDYPAPGNDTQCPVCLSVFHLEEDKQELLPLDVHVDEPIAKVLGWDDWIIFARTESGRLVYTNVEIHNAWFDSPHGGFHECDCPEKNMAVCRIDSSWMLMYVIEHKDEMYWQNGEGVTFHPGPYGHYDFETETFEVNLEDPHNDFNEALGWPPEKDAEFMANSRKAYLCD